MRLRAVARAAEGQPGRPGFAAILRGPAERPGAEWRDSILNPFSRYDKNPDLLAQELTALRAFHLRKIIRDYHLVDEESIRIENLTEPELGSLIMQRVRDLHA